MRCTDMRHLCSAMRHNCVPPWDINLQYATANDVCWWVWQCKDVWDSFVCINLSFYWLFSCWKNRCVFPITGDRKHSTINIPFLLTSAVCMWKAWTLVDFIKCHKKGWMVEVLITVMDQPCPSSTPVEKDCRDVHSCGNSLSIIIMLVKPC